MEAIRIANERKKNVVVNMKISNSRTGSSVAIVLVLLLKPVTVSSNDVQIAVVLVVLPKIKVTV